MLPKIRAGPSADRPASPMPFDQWPADEPEIRLHLNGLAWRHRWLILACTLASLGGALVYLRLAAPLYEATASLRTETKEPKAPEMWALNQGTTVATEMEMLGSRSLAEDATSALKLQIRLHKPRRMSRDEVLTDLEVAPGAREREYRLSRLPDGRFAVADADSDRVLTRVRPGERFSLQGVSLRLAPRAAVLEEIRLGIQPFADAVATVRDGITADRPQREGDILTVHYQDSDPELAWRVPNVIVQRFIERRRETQTIAARSQVKFLRSQIDTLSLALSNAEEELKRYRERARVVIPSVEASSQINRLITLETDRSTLEAERSALAKLVGQVDSQRGGNALSSTSPYRLFLAFPPLLRSQAASQLLGSLATIDDQRSSLLTRRTENDPDVQLLTARLRALEEQVSSMARTYLQGLNNQMGAMDTSIDRFSRDLRGMPQKELDYTRLERRPAVLKDMYTLLQTRLQEAEIAAAAENASVSIVDAAIAPRRPTRPRVAMSLLVGLLGGLLLGISCALIVEYLDRSIHTRMDVRDSTGLPVLGLVPRILGKASPVALITRPRKRDLQLPLIGAEQVSSSPGVALTISTKAGGIAEAYGALQTNLAFSRQDAPVKTLVFTSPLPGDGKTTTVANLAISLALRGVRVLLIDADVRRGVLHSVFGGLREPGLGEVLKGGHSLESARRSISVGAKTLDYLTAGKLVPGEYGLMASDAMRNLLARTREEYDLVIVDTPPVNIITDAAILATRADGVVLVARAGVTASAALSYAVEQLRHVRAEVLGVVLNDIDLRRDSAYDNTYKYFRGYEYSSTGQ